MRVLTLNLKSEYFNQIKEGSKCEEYREFKPYWEKRLSHNYDIILIKLGYPKKSDKEKILKFKFNGFKIKKIRHKEFGNTDLMVFAIDLSIPIP